MYEEKKKKSGGIGIVLGIVGLLIVVLLVCVGIFVNNIFGIFSTEKEAEIKTTKNYYEQMALKHVKEKYGIDAVVEDNYIGIRTELEETKNVERLITLDDGENYFEVLVIESPNKDIVCYDNYEEDLFMESLEQYFREKLGDKIELYIDYGLSPYDASNLTDKKYIESAINTLNTGALSKIFVAVEIPAEDINLSEINKDTFKEFFLNMANRKISIHTVRPGEDRMKIKVDNVADWHDLEEARYSIDPQGVYYDNIKIITGKDETLYSYNIEKHDRFYIFNPEKVKLSSTDKNASADLIPDKKKDFKHKIIESSEKYTFNYQAGLNEPVYVAIKITDLEDFSVNNYEDFLDIDAIFNDENGIFHLANGMLVGEEYMVFTLKDVFDMEAVHRYTDLYLIKYKN